MIYLYSGITIYLIGLVGIYLFFAYIGEFNEKTIRTPKEDAIIIFVWPLSLLVLIFGILCMFIKTQTIRAIRNITNFVYKLNPNSEERYFLK